jgi:hypothetical protein
MKVSDKLPWGRVLKAMRIVDRIQTHCETHNISSYDTYIQALRSFYMEHSWPSDATIQVVLELLDIWYIERIDKHDQNDIANH